MDDWDLTELNQDWDVGESGDDVPSPPPPLVTHSIFELFMFFSPEMLRDVS